MIIKNMKMPSGCYDCPFVKNKRTNDYGSFCECGILEDCETINLLEHSKHPNCPLAEHEPSEDCISREADNLCNSCTNIGCELLSSSIRTKCAFYMPPRIEPDNCGYYVV